MSFLLVRPYVKKNNRLGYPLVTAAGTYKKGAVVNDKIWKSMGYTRIKLRVIDTPEVTRELHRNKVQTYNVGGKSGFIYYSGGDAGYTFKVRIIVKKDDVIKGVGRNGKDHRVWSYLQYYYTHSFLVSVVADTLVIPNGVYVISDFTEYEPIRKDYFEADIEFTSYRKSSSKLTNKVTILQSYLKYCKKPKLKIVTGKQIKANKLKKNTCIQNVNKVLYGLGYLSKKNYKNYGGYWTKASHRGLVRFQKAWNKKGLTPKLNTKGNMTRDCWKAIKRYPEVK